MNIIFVGKRHGQSRVVAVGPVLGLTIVALVVTLLASAIGLGYVLATATAPANDDMVPAFVVAQWQQHLAEQQRELDAVRLTTSQQVDALTLRLGEMQGRLLRLDALGQRFVESGVVTSEEFDFEQPAAVGGPDEGMPGESLATPELSAVIAELESRIAGREQQLRLLDSLLSRKRLEDQRFVAGRPVTWGWLSSPYGYRTDPFTGRRTWHGGVDLAGKEGSDIIAVAAGVVTVAEDRGGYGNLIEVDHGNGLVTRYAHCKSLKAKVGDIVQKGQVIALMGSTGRSTGPHVHFEVLRNGRTENPEHYIRRASR
ncbi:M23 family metallopeptidase [Marinobacter sp. X15-166B]|uniref:M23 family metallopeptidase n=1 Tax=Marinobacter sp. X15-166B TaxID=1897620 RepID=UPI001D17AD97|nr:M23 family metallopeptidase [Marinobacter sp. X15-166B]